MASKLSYATITDVENFLLTTIDSSFHSQVEDWISTAEEIVNRYTGYTTASGLLKEAFTDQKVRVAVDTESNLRIFPPKTPIVSVSGMTLVRGTTSITLSLADSSGTPRYDIPWQSDQIIYPAEELSLNGVSTINNFSQLRGNTFFAKLSYIAGFDPLPNPVKLATVNLTADIIMRQANKEGLESIQQGRISKRWKENADGKSQFYSDAETLMNPYRHPTNWLY